MANIFIEIEVDCETGVINYSNPAARAHKRDVIQWKCEDGPFAIEFTGATPIAFQGARSKGRKRAGAHVVRAVVKSDAAAGIYQYACSVCAGEKVYLDARCPVIIIDL